MTKDEWLHYAGGWFKALPWRRASMDARLSRIFDIDIWAWTRELRQHPEDPILSPHQVAEAKAWGKGARACLKVDPPYPEPYPS